MAASVHDPNSDSKLEFARSKGIPFRESWHWDYLAVFLVILLIAGIRFRLRDCPLERDEGEYAYAGQLLLDGHPPYQIVYSMKLPGTYFAYAAIMSVFGQTAAGIHVGVMLVNAASMFLLFLITKELFDQLTAVLASATFGLFGVRPVLLGLAGHATHFVALAALASVFLVLKAYKTGQDRLLFWSGLCSGLAFVIKQPGLFFAIFGAFYVCWNEWNRLVPGRNLAKRLGYFSAGVVLPYFVTCVLLWRAAVFQRFWFWTVSYAKAYGHELSAWRSLLHFANAMEFQKENVLIIVFYPMVGILAAVGVKAAIQLIGRFSRSRALAAVPVLVFVLAFASALYADRKIYFLDSPDAAARTIYGDVPFPQAETVGRFIRANSGGEQRVGVLGSEPEILFYAHRISASWWELPTAATTMSTAGDLALVRIIRAAPPSFWCSGADRSFAVISL